MKLNSKQSNSSNNRCQTDLSNIILHEYYSCIAGTSLVFYQKVFAVSGADNCIAGTIATTVASLEKGLAFVHVVRTGIDGLF